MRRRRPARRICFVTGTRAEFGLMRSTLRAIAGHRSLKLQLIVTGMHLHRSRGKSVDDIRREGWRIDRVVPWEPSATPAETARQTGLATARIAQEISNLKSEIVVVVGDRVEAFAAAAAGHLSGCIVAHVHGGDRAPGQVDDALRHAITKLAHIHFPATRKSALRIAKLGEQPWRIRRVGSPGLDNLDATAARREPCPPAPAFALVVLHPVDADECVEFDRASAILRAVRSVAFETIVVVYPNNDPGSRGIVRCWERHATGKRFDVRRNVPRGEFIALMRDAAVMVGNSSAGIIEAASFGTPVIDVGPRQLGRERSQNVTNVPYSEASIRKAVKRIWNNGRPRRFPRGNVYGRNVYGGSGAGELIARALSTVAINDRLRRKLIAY